ncbi:YisL family protein [Staphylococcus lugdunensis]|uniref:YisL family protein n=1 Tax=Staphylococcus lugdunensis TaxID=28035 RepID=UPI001F586300|nr:YisL family protein [Staphylococcus lugdunensis]MCI2226345.1 YisL family protein [Staphylococcus lugdunensis]
MLHVHILSWVLAIIMFIVTYLNYSKTQGGTPTAKPLHMVLRVVILLTLISGFWIIIKEFASGGGNHILLTLKMVCGIAVVALMEVTIIKRKKHESTQGLFWTTIALIVITIILGIILPLGPLTKMFGLS